MAYNGNGQLTGITETVDGYSKSTSLHIQQRRHAEYRGHHYARRYPHAHLQLFKRPAHWLDGGLIYGN